MLTDTIAGLRALADFLEEKSFEVYGSLTVNLWPHSKEEFLEAARKVGACEKVESGGYLVLRKRFSDLVILELNGRHEYICTRKVTTRILPPEPERIVPAKLERVEEVVEWECPKSILDA